MGKSRDTLARVERALLDCESVHGMDMKDAPDIVTECLAIINGTACDECGAYPRRAWRWGMRHYTHCSQYDPEVWGHSRRP